METVMLAERYLGFYRLLNNFWKLSDGVGDYSNVIGDSINNDTQLSIYKLDQKNVDDYSSIIKHNHKRYDELSIELCERLLRTRRVLILPAFTNISVITNSYDVVHSWFLSNQGIKFDCVPGRSTHHMLYLDTLGDIRGQCAEVCGRFHHHMPIFLVGVNYSDFIVWWHIRSFLSKSDFLAIHKKGMINNSGYFVNKIKV
jgi:heme/copper-type cytochrome/quinol oxidase subunit 2